MHYVHTNQRALKDDDKVRTGCEQEECPDDTSVYEEEVTCPKCKQYIEERYSFSFYR